MLARAKRALRQSATRATVEDALRRAADAEEGEDGRPAHVAAVVDGSMTLCYSLDVKALTSIQTWIDSNVTVQGVVGGLLGTGDASKVCTIIHLKVAPRVDGQQQATPTASLKTRKASSEARTGTGRNGRSAGSDRS